MAEAVLDALQNDGVALIEAGTGTGKTGEYLVAAARHGGRTVNSTHTRNLQDQIATKDAPLVESALGRPLGLMVMKGLSYYLCLRRLDAYLALVAAPAVRDPQLRDLLEWSRATQTGDRAEIPWLADDDPVWREVSSGADVRLGYKCPRFDTCFVTRMRQRAARSRLLVVNHHLFFADLAVPPEAPSRVLPEWNAVVFDEAHDLEDAAAGFFGVRVSSRRVELLRGDVTRRVLSLGLVGRRVQGKARAVVLDQLDDAVGDLARLGTRLAELAGGGGEGDGAGRRAPLGEPCRPRPSSLYHAADSLGAWASVHGMGESDDELELLAARAETLRGSGGRDDRRRRGARRVNDAPFRGARSDRGRPGSSAATGRRGRPAEDHRPTARMPPGLALGRTPLDVAEILRARLFARGDSVVFTSATLADHRGFGFVRGRFGVPEDAVERRLESPFDFPRQAMLFVPEELPEPSAGEAFREAMLERTRELLELTGGGALLLYTSFRNQRWMAERLRAEGRDGLLVQGEAPRNLLLERLREERNAVLLATASFWQGVDVVGEALRLVVIDKLPFEVPNDPLTNARIERIRRAGGPRLPDPVAAIRCARAGRLIRCRTDRGIVAIWTSPAALYAARSWRHCPAAPRRRGWGTSRSGGGKGPRTSANEHRAGGRAAVTAR